MRTSAETLALLKGVYQAGGKEALQKAITTGTGLVEYDLQGPAKNLYPVLCPIRNKLPRVKGKGGVATNWKVVQAIQNGTFASQGFVPEGTRAGLMKYLTANKAASYATLGLEDNLSFEASSAAEGFEDVRSTMSMRLLQRMMLNEEQALLFGNASITLGVPGTPTLSAAGTGATLPAATYSVIVVALNGNGIANSSVSGGVATVATINTPEGSTYNVAGGSSNKSANATQAVTLGQTLTATAPLVRGAMAYAWYVGTVGNEILQAITYANVATFSAPLLTGTQAATAITADNSISENNGFDGLFSSAINPSSGAYYNALAASTTLTSSSRGTVNEIDVMLKYQWDTNRLSPTVLYVNSQEQQNITNKVLNASSGSLLRQVVDVKNPGMVVAGNVVSHYYNPFSMDGGQMIPVLLHPNVPAGSIIAWCEDLPVQYQSNEVPNVAEVHTRRDYYEQEWPLRTRKYEHGVYAEEVLAVYFPQAMSVITNITNG